MISAADIGRATAWIGVEGKIGPWTRAIEVEIQLPRHFVSPLEAVRLVVAIHATRILQIHDGTDFAA